MSRNKRVLLTGVGGFVGSHCLKYFLDNTDWEIITLDSFRHKGTYSRLDEILSAYDKSTLDRVHCLRHDLSVPIDEQLENRIMARSLNDRGQVVEKKLDYIISMASDSAVERSVSDPKHCWRNNCELAVNMLELARRVKPNIFFQVSTDEVYGDCPPDYSHPEWDVIVPSNPYAASKAAQEALAISYWRTFDVPVVLTNCHDIETRAFTPNGIKSIDELKVGDEVFVLKDDNTLGVEPILQVIKKHHSGNMVRIEHQKVDQFMTEDHRVLYRKATHGGYSPMKVGSAIDVIQNKRFRIPIGAQWVVDTSDIMSVSNLIGISQDELHSNCVLLPEEISTDWLAAISGWYVSEGSTAPGFISFAQEKLPGRVQIKCLLESIGLRASLSENGITTSSQPLQMIFEQFGDVSENKKLPLWLKSFSKECLEVFFDAAMQGDGSYIKNRSGTRQAVYYTKSYVLAQDMAEVGIKLGYASRISKRWTWNPAKTKKSLSYIVRFRKVVNDISGKRNCRVEKYDGDVWCLRVPSGNFAIERNGVISFSGNCMNCIATMQDKEKFLPKLIGKIASGEEMEVYADFDENGEAVIGSRYYLHVENHADAFVFLSNRPVAMYKNGDTRPDRYNIVGEVELNNLEMAQLVAKIMGKELKYKLVASDSARRGYDRRYALDGSKIKKIGWNPPVEFHQGLEKIVKWTLENPHWIV